MLMVAALDKPTPVVRIWHLALPPGLARQLIVPVKPDIEPPNCRLSPKVCIMLTIPGPEIGLARMMLLPTMATSKVPLSVIVPVPAALAALVSNTVRPELMVVPPL